MNTNISNKNEQQQSYLNEIYEIQQILSYTNSHDNLKYINQRLKKNRIQIEQLGNNLLKNFDLITEQQFERIQKKNQLLSKQAQLLNEKFYRICQKLRARGRNSFSDIFSDFSDQLNIHVNQNSQDYYSENEIRMKKMLQAKYEEQRSWYSLQYIKGDFISQNPIVQNTIVQQRDKTLQMISLIREDSNKLTYILKYQQSSQFEGIIKQVQKNILISDLEAFYYQNLKILRLFFQSDTEIYSHFKRIKYKFIDYSEYKQQQLDNSDNNIDCFSNKQEIEKYSLDLSSKPIVTQYLQVFQRFVKIKWQNLTQLYLSQNNITNNEFLMLIQNKLNFQLLEILDLSSNKIQNISQTNIEQLKSLQNLISLNIQKNSQDQHQLFNLLKFNLSKKVKFKLKADYDQINYLQLSRLQGNNEQILLTYLKYQFCKNSKQIPSIIPFNFLETVQYLNLSKCSLENKDFDFLICNLKLFRSVKQLDLHKNNISVVSQDNLIKLKQYQQQVYRKIKKKQVLVINLRENNIQIDKADKQASKLIEKYSQINQQRQILIVIHQNNITEYEFIVQNIQKERFSSLFKVYLIEFIYELRFSNQSSGFQSLKRLSKLIKIFYSKQNCLEKKQQTDDNYQQIINRLKNKFRQIQKITQFSSQFQEDKSIKIFLLQYWFQNEIQKILNNELLYFQKIQKIKYYYRKTIKLIQNIVKLQEQQKRQILKTIQNKQNQIVKNRNSSINQLNELRARLKQFELDNNNKQKLADQLDQLYKKIDQVQKKNKGLQKNFYSIISNFMEGQVRNMAHKKLFKDKSSLQNPKNKFKKKLASAIPQKIDQLSQQYKNYFKFFLKFQRKLKKKQKKIIKLQKQLRRKQKIRLELQEKLKYKKNLQKKSNQIMYQIQKFIYKDWTLKQTIKNENPKLFEYINNPSYWKTVVEQNDQEFPSALQQFSLNKRQYQQKFKLFDKMQVCGRQQQRLFKIEIIPNECQKVQSIMQGQNQKVVLKSQLTQQTMALSKQQFDSLNLKSTQYSKDPLKNIKNRRHISVNLKHGKQKRKKGSNSE